MAPETYKHPVRMYVEVNKENGDLTRVTNEGPIYDRDQLQKLLTYHCWQWADAVKDGRNGKRFKVTLEFEL